MWHSSMTPSVASFRALALTDPDALMNWIMSNELEESDLTFALEELGRAEDDPTVVDFLLLYSKSPSRIVREGAAEGLARHITVPRVRRRLWEMWVDDSSVGVRDTAGDIILI